MVCGVHDTFGCICSSADLWVLLKVAHVQTDIALEKSSATTDLLRQIDGARVHVDSDTVESYSRLMKSWSAILIDGLDGTWTRGSVFINLEMYKSLLHAYDVSGTLLSMADCVVGNVGCSFA